MTPNSIQHVDDLPNDWRDLYAEAMAAREQAYAPYSQFKVGAALRTVSGSIFSGCNVENSSYGLTVCAERVAMFKAVSEGHTQFESLAVVTDVGATPCGACRQVMSEFSRDMPILVADTDGRAHLTSLDKLLPAAYPHVMLLEMDGASESAHTKE